MSLITRAVNAADGLCVDTSFKLGISTARGLYSAGVRTVFRYVFFGQPKPGDIDAVELALLTDIGFTVVLVQHTRSPAYNELDAVTGKTDADWAVTNALAAGYDPALAAGPPPFLVLDMEGVRNPGPSSVAHVRAWLPVVAFAGFRPMVYLGYCSGLSSSDCDALPNDPLFWCDAGPYKMRPSPSKHFVLKQWPQSLIAGVNVDRNDVLQDGVLFGLASGVRDSAPVPAAA